jgi:hypothetical protein
MSMSAYYQTVLSLNIVVFVLAAGLIAGYQVIAGAGGPRGTPLRARNSAFLVLAFLNMAVAIVGAVLLGTPHDFMPGVDLGTDAILASPLMGLVIGATTVLCAALAVRALLRASGALSPAESVTLKTTSVRQPTSDQPTAPVQTAEPPSDRQ